MGWINKNTNDDITGIQAFIIVAILGILAGLGAIAFLEIII
jgi:hypothetical protein